MKELTVDAILGNVDQVQGFIEQELEVAEVSMKGMMTISIAVEEIYVNIAHYAYLSEVGKVTIRYMLYNEGEDRKVAIQFIDGGIPYNPLEKKEADITLSAEEREIGGLGILMVKKSMDNVTYEYKERQNILTIEKKI